MTAEQRRVALVTGGSGAIGGAIAKRFAAGGDRVAVHYHGNREKAEAVVAAIRQGGGEADAVRADVTLASEVESMMAEVTERWGHIDVLVNNAGITRDTLLVRMDESDWDAVIATNLKSAYVCAKAVTRAMMRRRSGRILNVSSIVGIAGNAGQANYAAAKAGLLGLTRSLAKELASRGITANAIAPGFIDAGMTEGLGAGVREQALAFIPLGRFGSVEDVAEAAWFLCSDAAGYITGQVLQVDGGMVMA
ncbi:MAG: 3-oxoacyl-[acyl-carrier-protein] reductase [Chloroflexota bacterium]